MGPIPWEVLNGKWDAISNNAHRNSWLESKLSDGIAMDAVDLFSDRTFDLRYSHRQRGCQLRLLVRLCEALGATLSFCWRL